MKMSTASAQSARGTLIFGQRDALGEYLTENMPINSDVWKSVVQATLRFFFAFAVNAQIYIVTVFCMSIVTIFVLLRTYTRFSLIKRRGWQDYTLLLAWILSLCYMITMPVHIKYGSSVHQWNVTVEKYLKFVEKTNDSIIIYSATICLVKLAILIQLAHIFTPFKSKMYWTICLISALTVMFYVACIIVGALECIPREKIWKPDVPGTCINSEAAIITSAVVNTVSDFVLFIIPVSRIAGLQMPKQKKWAVAAVFSTGLFCCIASIMRMVISVDLLETGDETYGFLNLAFWSDAEITSGIICCCLPVLPQFYRTHIAGFVTSLRGRLQSYTTVTARLAPDSISGDSSGTRETTAVHGPLSPNTHPYIELKTPRIGIDAVQPEDDGGKLGSRRVSIKSRTGLDVEHGEG